MNDKKRTYAQDGFSISELKSQVQTGVIIKKSLSLSSFQTALNNKPLEKISESSKVTNQENKNKK